MIIKENFMKYICEVCGYPYLIEPPYDKNGNGSYIICPCCGFEFGYDDYPDKEKSIIDWRNNWIENGYIWFSEKKAPPINWNPQKQLINIVK